MIINKENSLLEMVIIYKWLLIEIITWNSNYLYMIINREKSLLETVIVYKWLLIEIITWNYHYL